MSATSGDFYFEDPVTGKNDIFPPLPYNASLFEAQMALESIYGAGNVEVDEGQGDATGSKPYVIHFKGARADQQVQLTAKSFPPGFSPYAPLKGGTQAEAIKVVEATQGKPDGQIVITAVNLGDASLNPQAQPVTITDKLPSGLKAVRIEELEGELFKSESGECSLETVSCTFSGKSVPPYDQIRVVVSVIMTGAKSGEVNEASVSGGETPNATASQSLVVGSAPTPFGVRVYEMRPEEEGGGLDMQAGSHPFQLTTTFDLNETADGTPPAPAKDLRFKLPAGLIGNPTPFAQCTLAQFLAVPE
ncbi:MAG TPA: hypothetical protein VK781_04225, partial [Solirubrobacteraceae bacterium]|nr:hypothetical protein [Solirubrobacteraceae bacterium]